jgi:hypothetical protein
MPSYAIVLIAGMPAPRKPTRRVVVMLEWEGPRAIQPTHGQPTLANEEKQLSSFRGPSQTFRLLSSPARKRSTSQATAPLANDEAQLPRANIVAVACCACHSQAGVDFLQANLPHGGALRFCVLALCRRAPLSPRSLRANSSWLCAKALGWP